MRYFHPLGSTDSLVKWSSLPFHVIWYKSWITCSTWLSSDRQLLWNQYQSTPRLYLMMSYWNPPKIAHKHPCCPLWSQSPFWTWKIPYNQTVQHLVASQPIARWWRPRLRARCQYEVASLECWSQETSLLSQGCQKKQKIWWHRCISHRSQLRSW